MHNLDRSTLEANNFDYEEEFDYEMDDEMNDEYDYESDYEMDYESDYEMDDEYDYELGGTPLSEEEEAEFAFELLEVSSDQEMDEFFKRFFRRIGRGIKKIARNPLRAIGRGLKKVAKAALPIAGGLAGSFIGGPLGKKLGTKAGSMASNLFEIELEGLSPEDQEFEVAKRFVRFGSAATRNTMKLANKMPIEAATKLGFKKAAAKHAPGMLKTPNRRPGISKRPIGSGGGSSDGMTGRWIRKGNQIILLGL